MSFADRRRRHLTVLSKELDTSKQQRAVGLFRDEYLVSETGEVAFSGRDGGLRSRAVPAVMEYGCPPPAVGCHS
jgi:hypothetical protein